MASKRPRSQEEKLWRVSYFAMERRDTLVWEWVGNMAMRRLGKLVDFSQTYNFLLDVAKISKVQVRNYDIWYYIFSLLEGEPGFRQQISDVWCCQFEKKCHHIFDRDVLFLPCNARERGLPRWLNVKYAIVQFSIFVSELYDMAIYLWKSLYEGGHNSGMLQSRFSALKVR